VRLVPGGTLHPPAKGVTPRALPPAPAPDVLDWAAEAAAARQARRPPQRPSPTRWWYTVSGDLTKAQLLQVAGSLA
jgi:hypothetical protein